MNIKNRFGILSSDPHAEAEAGKDPDHQAEPTKSNGLKPVGDELEDISGGRDNDGHHAPPRM